MSNAPKTLWLQWFDGEDDDEVQSQIDDPDWYPDEPTWCQDQINDADVKYHRADLAHLPPELVERIKEQQVAFMSDMAADALWRHDLLRDILAAVEGKA